MAGLPEPPAYVVQASSGDISAWAMLYLNLPNGYQHDPKSMQSPDQADQPGLIHDDIGERCYLATIRLYFGMSFRFSKPAQPGVVRLTINFDLIPILRIQTDGLRHIRPLREGHARPRTSPRIRNRKNTLWPECKMMGNQLLFR